MTRRERRRLAVALGISLALAGLLSLALWNQWLRTQQAAATDIFFQTWSPTGVREVANNVLIVAIDDASVQRLGRFGDWPRDHYTRVVDRLREGYARVIAFDVGFFEPQADDPAVVEAITRFREVGPEELQRAGLPANRRSVISPLIGTPSGSRLMTAGVPPAFPESLEPLPGYVRVSTRLGHVNVLPDDDGTVRKNALLIRAGDLEVPSLALAAAAAYTNTLNLGFSLDPQGYGLAALRRYIPIDPFFQMTISYAGSPSRLSAPGRQTFQVVPFIDVMEGRVDPTLFHDKMVFVGLLDASGFADDFWVPTSGGVGKMHGVEIHANAFATLVAARFFTEQQYPVTVAIIGLFCLVTGLAAARLSIVPSALITLALGVIYFGGSLRYADLSYDPLGVAIPNLVYPPVALLLTFLCVTVYRVVFEQAETRATRSAMGKYLSPAVLTEVLKDPDQLKLGGEKRVMSVLFSDIRGFTSVSEHMDPVELLSLLNEYLTVMTNLVHERQGVLDKYMGDAIMAWWGAPTEQPDHAYRACMTALEMRAALRQLHQGWDQRGVPRLEMGVGINTGPMVYGNTGSHDRFDFTVMGDSVNLASRLEGANKEYASNVIISGSTLEHLADHSFVTRFLDLIEVKGKTEPAAIYELLGRTEEVDPTVADLVAAWEGAMELYRRRDFALAEAGFRRALEIRPGDGPAQVYLQRCQELAATPPAPDWDGVYVMTHK